MARRSVAVCTLLTLAAALAACGGDDSSSPPGNNGLPPELVGSWRATAACAAAGCRIVAHSTVSADSLNALAAPLSMDLQLTIQGGGAVSAALGAGGLGQVTRSGQAHILSGHTVAFAYTNGTADTVDYTVSGNLLHLDFRNRQDVFTFVGQPQLDPATLQAVLQKQ